MSLDRPHSAPSAGSAPALRARLPHARASLCQLSAAALVLAGLSGLATPGLAQDPAAAAGKVEKAAPPADAVPLAVYAYGRVKLGADAMYTYQWPGTYFLFAYKGSAFYFRTQGKQNLHVFVDGHSTGVMTDGDASYAVNTPGGGAHVVRIDSVNESAYAPEALGGFAVSHGGAGIPFPTSKRQMEFIGDSHTVGYGNTSTTRECTNDDVYARTDVSRSLGAQTALHYNANYQIDAISGHGVVRNYDGGAGDPVPVAYPFQMLDKQQRYNDPAWHPQVIAVSLGTNDFSTALHPTETWKSRDALHADFERTYVSFLQELRKRNPKALIVLWNTDASDGEIASEAQKVVQQVHAAGDKRVDFVEVSGLAFTACHYHPSVADDTLISNKLIADIDRHRDVWPDAGTTKDVPPATIPPADPAPVLLVAPPPPPPPPANGAAQLAITWDDLPAHGELPHGLSRLELTEEIVHALGAEHAPPSYGFINGSLTAYEPQSDAVFRTWIESGNLLGNHTWSHKNPADISTADYEADIAKNEPLLRKWMGDKDWHWFRYPFLAEGKSPEQKQEIRQYLASNHYKVAAVTLGFPDYDWDAPYVRCVNQGNKAETAKLEAEYLQSAHDAAVYSRTLSHTLFGKDIPYVILLHVGPLDAKMLPRTLAQFRSMGFTFVPLAQAEADPFYRADVDPSLPGGSASLAGAMYGKNLPVPPGPTHPDLQGVCR